MKKEGYLLRRSDGGRGGAGGGGGGGGYSRATLSVKIKNN